jgi:hypothetical protein
MANIWVDVALPVLSATVVIALAVVALRFGRQERPYALWQALASPWRQSRGHDGSWPYRSWTADLPAYGVLKMWTAA